MFPSRTSDFQLGSTGDDLKSKYRLQNHFGLLLSKLIILDHRLLDHENFSM
jgi:hypothetical protein